MNSRPIVTAGLAMLVDEVNQYAAGAQTAGPLHARSHVVPDAEDTAAVRDFGVGRGGLCGLGGTASPAASWMNGAPVTSLLPSSATAMMAIRSSALVSPHSHKVQYRARPSTVASLILQS